MGHRGLSHIAVGVRDMDRSLAFYRDLLGMEVADDHTEQTRGRRMYADPERSTTRRVAHLHWPDDPDATFLVLSTFPDTTGEPIKLDQVGIHHVAFWVTGLHEKAARLREAGVPFVMKPIEIDGAGYQRPDGERIATCLLEDPDGIILQLDEVLT